ncbi:aminoglycoside phosphotransferase family protein [Bacillus sp. PAMC26568]|nr:aminoglycoside phosphotransferase family protein [Bacillus sp. PAMC26568]
MLVKTSIELEMNSKHILGEGSAAVVYSYENDKAVKVCRYGTADYEFQVNQLLMKKGIRVPIAYEIVKLDGKDGIVFEKIEGTSLTSTMMKGPLSMLQSLKLMARLQADFHTKSGVSLKSQRHGLKRNIDEVNLRRTEKDMILKVLAKLPEGDLLCHGDFHPDNILCTTRGPIIIDWADASAGHPIADLARTLLLLKYGGMKKRRGSLEVIRNWISMVYACEYRKHHSFSLQELKNWELPVAAARLTESIPHYEKVRLLSIIRSHLKK